MVCGSESNGKLKGERENAHAVALALAADDETPAGRFRRALGQKKARHIWPRARACLWLLALVRPHCPIRDRSPRRHRCDEEKRPGARPCGVCVVGAGHGGLVWPSRSSVRRPPRAGEAGVVAWRPAWQRIGNGMHGRRRVRAWCPPCSQSCRMVSRSRQAAGLAGSPSMHAAPAATVLAKGQMNRYASGFFFVGADDLKSRNRS